VIDGFKIIDCHVHSGYWLYKAYRYEHFNVLEYWKKYKFFVDIAMFMPAEDKDNKSLNILLQNLKNSYRFFWYDPFDIDNQDFGNIIGFKVHASIDRIISGISNCLYNSMIEAAIALGYPILCHCGGWTMMSNPCFIVKQAKQFSNIQFIAAHCGGKDDKSKLEAIDIFAKYDNIFVDTSATKYTEVIKYAVKKLGPERILFGSDWPIMNPISNFYVIMDANLKQKQTEQILFKNSQTLFNINE